MSRLYHWRMTPRALFRLVLALLLALAYAYNSRAQEANAPESSAVVNEDRTGDAAELEPPSASVQAALTSIQARNPDDAVDWINAVIILRRMGAHAEAKTFLDQAIDANLNQQSMAELHAAIGTAELVGLSVDKHLPEARAFVFSVFDAVRNAKRDPEILRKATEGLSSEREDVRRHSRHQLIAAGPHAIPPIVTALQNEPPSIDVGAAEEVILQLGLDAEEPLLALLGAPHPTLQTLAARMLGPIGSKRATWHLLRPYFVATEPAKRSAAEYYRDSGSLPKDAPSAASFLLDRAEHHLQGNPPVRADVEGNVEIWTWSAEQRNIVAHVLEAEAAAAVVAARFARDAHELNPTPRSTRMLLVSRFQVDQSLGGLDEDLPRDVGSGYQLGVTLGLDAVRAALDYSLDHGHDAAAQAACELIAHHCRNRAASGWSSLTHALRHPNRRVRYAAARAIMAVDPRKSFSGASHFQEALIDLADASGTPHAVVGMARRDASDNLSGALSSLGFSVTQTTKASHLLDLVSKSSDVDIIFLSDSVSRPTARETIQRLRHHRLTKYVPIVLMARNDNHIQAQRIARIDADARTIVIPEFVSEESLRAALAEAESLVRGKAVSPQRRQAQARDALRWLSHLAQYSQTYSWYDLQRAETVSLRAATQPALAGEAMTLLGYLGGAAAQRQLVALTGQKDLTLAQRQRAANALTEAVARRGLMLKNEDVLRQYDRYNASEHEELAAQELLGQVLDVIETQTRPPNGGETTF